jgi:Na+/phosphate symporter
MLGATVGTTFKAWLFAEHGNAMGPLLIGVTSLALILLRHPLAREACEAALSIGFTFLGLDMLARGLSPLAQEPAFAVALRHFDGTNLGSQALGALTG